jgi:hypothetical protein
MIRKTLLALSLLLLAGTVGVAIGFRDRTFVYFNPPYSFTASSDGRSLVVVAAKGYAGIKIWRPGPRVVKGIAKPGIRMIDYSGTALGSVGARAAVSEIVLVPRVEWGTLDGLKKATFTFIGMQFDALRAPTWKHVTVGASLWLVAALAACYPCVLLLGGSLHRYYRRRHNQCLKCGYDLTGNVSGRCSECGSEIRAAIGAGHDA